MLALSAIYPVVEYDGPVIYAQADGGPFRIDGRRATAVDAALSRQLCARAAAEKRLVLTQQLFQCRLVTAARSD
ncbi:MAG: hypothetical protein RLZZ456_1355 [Pseudomonadota bacterium]